MNVCSVDLKGEPGGRWRLYPIGDLHCDLKLFNEAKLRRYVRMIADDPRSLWVSVGDYIDGTTPDHKYFNPQVINDDILSNIDQYVDRVYQRLEDLLSPLRGHPGVMLEGNHEKRGGLKWAGFVPSLARNLKAQYLGYEGLVRVLVSASQRVTTTTIHAQHGYGGGRKPGAKINTFQDSTLATADADVYLRGHTEDAFARVLPVYDVTKRGKLNLVVRYKAWLSAAGFYGNRVEGINHYNAEKGMPSVDEGTFYLEISEKQFFTNGEKPRSRIIRRCEFI